MSKKVTLVLSGGGARGSAHIGVIEEILNRGYDIASVTGTSMGALVGGVYALGKLDEFKTWICSLDKIKVFQLVDFSFSTQGLIKGDRVLSTIKEFIPDRNIEDLKLPFAAIAVDIVKGEEVVFKSGSIFSAIRASIAIPTVITPSKRGNQLLVDGGVLNNIPVNHANRVSGDILIAVNVNANIPFEKPKVDDKQEAESQSVYLQKMKEFQHYLQKLGSSNHHEEKMGYFELMSETISLMTYHIAHQALEKNPPDLMINISRDSCDMFDFFKSDEQVEIGRHAAIKALDAYENNAELLAPKHSDTSAISK